MPRRKRDRAEELIQGIRAAARRQLQEELLPIVREMASATGRLLGALSKVGSIQTPRPVRRRRRRGRPRKAAAAPAARAKRAVGAKRGGRAPRGLLVASIRNALRASGPLGISKIRDRLLQIPAFRNHNPRSLYTMITNRLPKLSDISKTPQGYALTGSAEAGGAAGRGRRRGRPRKRAAAGGA